MNFLVLQMEDGQSGLLVVSFDREEVVSEPFDSETMYNHIRLAEYFPQIEDLQREHVLLITNCPDEDELNDIIENELQIDRAIERVHVCEFTPDMLAELQGEPARSRPFSLGEGLPLVVVLLGGQEGLERWMAQSLEKAD